MPVDCHASGNRDATISITGWQTVAVAGEVSADARTSLRGGGPSDDGRRNAGASVRRPGLRLPTIGVAAAILLLTGVLAWLAGAVAQRSAQHVLDLRTRRAADVVSTAILSIQPQLLDTLQVAQASGSPAAFDRFAANNVGGRDGFTSLSLWQQTGTGVRMLGLVGPPPRLESDHRLASTFLGNLRPKRVPQVTGIFRGKPRAVGFAEMPLSDTSGLIVYAEAQAPLWRPIALPRASAFKDLGLAEYLGPHVRTQQLMVSSVPTPVHGQQSSTTLPFGDTTITLVGTPTGSLNDALSAYLPWVVIGTGVLLAAASGLTVEAVLRRRLVAEHLAAVNTRLYRQQRDVAETLQRALLADLPPRSQVDVAARFLPGERGVDVGGDWYDVSYPSERRCTFVVGDVSGRGLGAATTMASLRFGARAYLTQGDGPSAVLCKLDRLLQTDVDHRMATVLIGELDLDRRRLSLASAGHFAPLFLENGRTRFLEVAPGPPIGTGPTDRPTETVVDLVPGARLLAFTDGLVERRGEHLDAGLARLVEVARAASADGTPAAPATGATEGLPTGCGTVPPHRHAVEAPFPGGVDELVDRVATALIPDGTEDDVVILGLSWPG